MKDKVNELLKMPQSKYAPGNFIITSHLVAERLEQIRNITTLENNIRKKIKDIC